MNKKQISLTAFVMTLLLLISTNGCTVIQRAVSSLSPTSHFLPLSSNPQVYYEPGAEKFAEEMGALLPQAMEKVEKEHYRAFTKEITIYICASQKSYTRLTGLKTLAYLTSKGVFFSPRLVEERRPLLLYLTHELSHLHIAQQIGQYKFAKLPVWFIEGLAVMVSNGGGAQNVTAAQAKGAFKKGKYFIPNTQEDSLIRQYGRYWHLSPQLFYQQSMMFVKYLKETDEKRYRNLLLNIQDGANFINSFNHAFDDDIMDIWKDFLRDIKKD